MASTVLKFFCSSSPESTASKEAIWAARWAAWTPDRPRGWWDGWEECEITESFWWFLELWYGIDLYLSTEVIFARGSLIVRSPQLFQMKLSLWNLTKSQPRTGLSTWAFMAVYLYDFLPILITISFLPKLLILVPLTALRTTSGSSTPPSSGGDRCHLGPAVN